MSAPADGSQNAGAAADDSGLERAAVEVEQGVEEVERASAELAARSRVIVKRSIGSPRLFAIVYTSLASAIYFSLGVIAGHALGLTPLVFLLAALFFALTALDLCRGRLPAPGARRLDRVRALRVQRARQLRRGLGDAAGLHDPDRRHVLLGDPVPARVLASARHTATRRCCWRSRSSRWSCSPTSAASAGAARGGSGCS